MSAGRIPVVHGGEDVNSTITDPATAAPKLDKETIRKATEMAAKAIRGLRLPPGATAGQVAEAFGRALAVTHPRSGHGKVLTGALRNRKPAERTPAERVAWWLAARGETPTEQAVVNRLGAIRERRERAEERMRAVGQLAGRDGPKAARYVADVIVRTGTGPTWRELGAAMGWPERIIPPIVVRLERAGWLATSDAVRSLRPGWRRGQPACL